MGINLNSNFDRVAGDFGNEANGHSLLNKLGFPIVAEGVRAEPWYSRLICQLSAEPRQFVSAPLFVEDVRPCLPSGIVQGNGSFPAPFSNDRYVLEIWSYASSREVTELLRAKPCISQKPDNGTLLFGSTFEDFPILNIGNDSLTARLRAKIFDFIRCIWEFVKVLKVFIKATQGGQNDVS